MRRKFIVLSAVASAAAERTARAAAAVAGGVEYEKCDDHEPKHLVIEKITKTVHLSFCADSADAVLSFGFRAQMRTLISFYERSSIL